jgi:pullulanase/glycogen debranching enzyme
MFARLENPFNKVEFGSNKSNNFYLDAVASLLDLTGDKDETVRATCEASLVRVSSRSPNEVINFIIAHKKKTLKPVDSVVAVILR